MMPWSLKVSLIVISIFFIAVVVYSINRRRLQMRHSLMWLFLAVCMIVIAVFPEVVGWMAPVLGIETPANLVFLVAMVVLLLICFMLTVMVSKQAEQIKTLTQWMAIRDYLESTSEEGTDENAKQDHAMEQDTQNQ